MLCDLTDLNTGILKIYMPILYETLLNLPGIWIQYSLQIDIQKYVIIYYNVMMCILYYNDGTAI